MSEAWIGPQIGCPQPAFRHVSLTPSDTTHNLDPLCQGILQLNFGLNFGQTRSVIRTEIKSYRLP